MPWKLLKRETQEVKKRVFVCPEPSCLHHDPLHALGDLVGIKKHFRRKHSNHKQWVCEKCSKGYAVQSDYKAHLKTCGTRGHSCDCGRVFSRFLISFSQIDLLRNLCFSFVSPGWRDSLLYSLLFIQNLACSGRKVLLPKLICFPLSSFIITLKFAKVKAFPFSFWISWKSSTLKAQFFSTTLFNSCVSRSC